jgi:hypothetical protein
MKKLYVLVALVVAASVGYAQQAVPALASTGHKTTAPALKHTKLKNTNHFRQHGITPTPTLSAVIWSDDFSNPANWVMTQEAGTTDSWVIDTAGSDGPFSIGTILSTTASNGFALFDSDTMCSGEQDANLTTANSIDLTGHPSVRITFEQLYASYIDSTFIYVSTDGTSWTRFDVNNSLPDYTASSGGPTANPDLQTIDISSVAGNQATVWIRFNFYSRTTTMGAGAGCGYAWMIDDVAISDIPSDDAMIFSSSKASEYTSMPILQVQPLDLSTQIINNGSAQITSATVTFEVFDASFINVFTEAVTATLALNANDTSGAIVPTGSYTPVDTGIHFIQYSVAIPNDNDSGNDTTLTFVYVDDSTYARDWTFFDTNDFAGGFGIQSTTIQLAQRYQIFQSSAFTSVNFYLSGPELNDSYEITVMSSASGVPDQVLGTTGVMAVNPSDTGGAFLNLPFLAPVSVTPGEYFIVMNQLDTNNITLGASNLIVTPGSTLYSVAAGTWTDVVSDVNVAWILRPNNPSSTLVGIDNVENNSAFMVYPNPANGIIYINSQNAEKDALVTVTNSLGQIVFSQTYSTLQTAKIDLSSQSAGVYVVRVAGAHGVSTRNVVLK